jgi:Spy/CpxP family protein refolding chaperone
MRQSNYCWPWRFAYPVNHSDKPHYRSHYETRWQQRGGRNFGVRRPLRYLAHRLDLDDSQTRKMASILNQLKTEREQAELDEKRTVAGMANLLADGTPTLDEIREVLSGRVRSAEHLQEETAKAVVAISNFLDDDQRDEFTNLLLTGAVSF